MAKLKKVERVYGTITSTDGVLIQIRNATVWQTLNQQQAVGEALREAYVKLEADRNDLAAERDRLLLAASELKVVCDKVQAERDHYVETLNALRGCPPLRVAGWFGYKPKAAGNGGDLPAEGEEGRNSLEQSLKS
jgi:hypothetical protein